MNAKEVSKSLNISLRMVQLYCKELNISKKRNRYNITENDFVSIKERHHAIQTNENETQTIEIEYRTELYTEEEYNELHKRLVEYNLFTDKIADLKNEVQYLRNSLDKQSEQMNVLLNSFNNTIASIRERNALDYKKITENE
jgi:DNA-binding transcriptional MerR regulator